MYLSTSLDRFEYMQIPVKLIPEDFIVLYQLHDKIKDGHIHMQIECSMYGLPQAGILANKILHNP